MRGLRCKGRGRRLPYRALLQTEYINRFTKYEMKKVADEPKMER